MDEIKLGSNRSFGIVFFIVFVLIAIYPLINQGEVRIWSLIISFLFLFLGLLNSKILTPLNKLWFRFGLFLGKIISPIIMAVIFFLVVTPIGLLMRLFGKDVLNLKLNKKKSSYWIEKVGPKSKMKNQF
ncbi:MAG: SxtJ family membrane protein [Pseudomonadota bacterium]|nr:SxtJ family membrane protein [Pseudomonadota bacterium]